MANAWKRGKDSSPFLFLKYFFVLVLISTVFLLFPFFLSRSSNSKSSRLLLQPHFPAFPTPIPPLDCNSYPQASPVFASVVEGVKYPFFFSLADFGSLPEKPHKNIVRMMKGKGFRKPDISVTMQELLEGRKGEMENGIVVDVGANVGMSTFAAAVMGFRVLAFEPVFENLQRICEGVFFNRVGGKVAVFAAAASDRRGNITFHKLIGRLDNSAVSASSAKLAFKSNEEIEMQVTSIPLDDIIPDSEPVLIIKIDVQGWEYHVLKGASRLLSRRQGKAPYLIYEEDERLLRASNSSRHQIREFLRSVGYHHCTMQGGDAHCVKE